MTRPERALFAGLLCWALLRMVSCGAPVPVHAQSDALLTARVCFSESRRADECVQIVHATAERAVMHGRSYRAELVAYSPRATGRRSYGPRSWIASLHPDRIVAASFAEPMSRELVRVRFVVLMRAAWGALYGGEPPPLSRRDRVGCDVVRSLPASHARGGLSARRLRPEQRVVGAVIAVAILAGCVAAPWLWCVLDGWVLDGIDRDGAP